jgi:tight adherence protein C
MSELLTSIPLPYFVAAVGVAIGLVAFLFLGQADERSVVRSTLRQLDDYEVDNTRDQQLLVPLSQRLFGPVLRLVASMAKRLNPPEYIEGVRRKFAAAGVHSHEAVERHLVKRVLGIAFIPVWLAIMLLWNPLGVGGLVQLALTGIVAGGMFLLPDSQLNAKVETRQKEIQRALPDTLDLLVISVEAGLGFEQALDRVVQNVPGSLSAEFATLLGETRAGSSRADALRALDQRCNTPEVRSFVLAMIQADTFGVSIGRVLRGQADEMRIKRRQRAQEQAMKAPVKMLMPMVFCVFPALFVVVLGPAIINIMKNFS